VSRSRNIKPGFFKNDLLAECEPLARLLFAGLWCQADREGRLEDRPKRIKADCLPYDDCDIEDLLDQLASRGFIVRYVVDGKGFIASPTFLTHQNPHCKEAASSIPAPDKHSASTVQASENTVLAEKIPELARLIPDSLNLIPDSLQKQKHVQRTAARFAEFWDAYPEKKGRAAAEKSWRAKGLDAHADAIIAHVQRMRREDDSWRSGYAPHGSTYVNGERWTDEPRSAKPAPQLTPSKTLTAVQKLQGMKHGHLDSQRDFGRADETHVFELGSDSGS